MKKKIVLILILLLSAINVHAVPTTYNREELDNYGVKKNWKITDSNRSNVLNTPAVDAKEKIYDFSDVMTDEQESELKSKIDEFTSKYNMDLVIVTYNLEYPSVFSSYCYSDAKADNEEDKFNETFASDFYDYNDFGMDFENNSGIVLFRNTAIDPCYNAMYYDMYTFGNAQLYFNRYRYDQILDSIFDNLKGGNYTEGFNKFINLTSNYLDQGRPSELEGYTVDEKGYLQAPPRVYKAPISSCLILGLLIAGIVVGIMIAKNKMVKKATEASEYLNKGSVKITNRKDVFVRSHTSSYTTSSSSGGSSGGGGGFSSHSGSSGGGHSSGGGRHG